MSPRRTTPIALFVGAVAATMLGAVAPATTADAVRASSNQFLLTFDHRESLRTGTKVVDASGHRHSGTVLSEHGGRLHVRSGIVRRAADFPDRCRRCGRSIVEIPDKKGLDPQRRTFVFGAAIRVQHSQMVNGANIVQKGYYNQDGGQWKLQLGAGGAPSCIVFGDGGRVLAASPTSIANGRWHQVTCTRTATQVVLRVDGVVRARVAGPTGRIANTAPIRIGGKKIAAGNKQFHGRLDNVFMRLLPRPSRH